MTKQIIRLGFVGMAMLTAFTSCSDEQQFTNVNTDAKRTDVQQISPEMAKVRDYVPLYACVAHRGSTYWAPEETEAAWRWARNMGADYLESDLQVTKDGVVLANHDENLKRTTNIASVFSDDVPTKRKDFYRSFRNRDGSQHFSEADIEAQYQRDVADFRANYTMSYYYAELLVSGSTTPRPSWAVLPSPQVTMVTTPTTLMACPRSTIAMVSMSLPCRIRSTTLWVRSSTAMPRASAC